MANEVLPPWLLQLLIARAQADALAADAPYSGAVTFPTADLQFRVLLGVGQSYAAPADLSADWRTWNWLDITQYVRYDLGISVKPGRTSNGTTQAASPGSMTMKLDNAAKSGTIYPEAGRFARRNANSSLFGLLSLNTPIWVQVDPGSGFVTVAQMFVNDWPVRWSDKSATDSTVTITCGGVLRRLQQAKEARSALGRFVRANDPYVYWPLTESRGSVTGAVVGSGRAATVEDVDQLGAGDLAADWLEQGCRIRPNQSVTMIVNGMSSAPESITVDWVFRAPEEQILTKIVGNGTTPISFWLYFTGMPFKDVEIYVYQGSTQVGYANNLSYRSAFTDQMHHVRVQATQNGADIDYTVGVDGVEVITDTVTTKTLQGISRVAVSFSDSGNTEHAAVGHVAAWEDSAPTLAEAYAVASGYVGETAVARMRRLCAEDGITFTCVSPDEQSPAMGPQPVGSLPDLLRECEAVDQGVLFENGFGLGYRSRWELSNQSVALALDVDSRHLAEIPEPRDDDRDIRNKWTVSRGGGSETSDEVTDGSMGSGSEGPGFWPDSTSVNVATDDLLTFQAAWRTHRDTVDVDRWEDFALNLGATPDLIPSLLALPAGGRVTVANLPADTSSDAPDVLVMGVAYQLWPKRWLARLVNVPNAANHMFELAGTSGDAGEWLGYLVPDTWTLSAALDTTSTTFTATVDPLFSTDSDDWAGSPLIVADGERMALTGVSGGSSPQTFTVTRSVNGVVKSHSSGAEVEFVSPGALGL